MSKLYPALAVGIDIGKDSLTLCTGAETPVINISLADALWSLDLAAQVGPLSVAALEPTGWFYSAPIIALLQHQGARVLIVEHATTAQVRETHVAKHHKSDTNDARALFYVAEQHAHGLPLLGTRPAAPDLEARAAGLRLLVLSQKRSDQGATRAINRLHQVAHAIWPALGQHTTTYLRAVEAGYVTPADLRNLADRFKRGLAFTPPEFADGRKRRHVANLIANLPPWLEAEELRSVINSEAWAYSYHSQRAQELADLVSTVVQAPPFTAITALWLTVPGAGLLDIAALQGATHGQAATMTPAEMRACCGCHPVISQSGKETHSSLTRQGFRPARSALHLWVMRAIKTGEPAEIAAYFKRRQARGEQFAMAASRGKLVNILSGMARNGTPYISSVPGEQSDWLLPDADTLSKED